MILIPLNGTLCQTIVDTGAELLVMSLDVVAWARFPVINCESLPLIIREGIEVQSTHVVCALNQYQIIREEHKFTVVKMAVQLVILRKDFGSKVRFLEYQNRLMVFLKGEFQAVWPANQIYLLFTGKWHFSQLVPGNMTIGEQFMPAHPGTYMKCQPSWVGKVLYIHQACCHQQLHIGGTLHVMAAFGILKIHPHKMIHV